MEVSAKLVRYLKWKNQNQARQNSYTVVLHLFDTFFAKEKVRKGKWIIHGLFQSSRDSRFAADDRNFRNSYPPFAFFTRFLPIRKSENTPIYMRSSAAAPPKAHGSISSFTTLTYFFCSKSVKNRISRC